MGGYSWWHVKKKKAGARPMEEAITHRTLWTFVLGREGPVSGFRTTAAGGEWI